MAAPGPTQTAVAIAGADVLRLRLMHSFRAARGSDHALYARLFPDLQTPDQPPPAAVFERDLVPTSFVLEVDGADAGFAYVQVLEGTGYVRQILLEPAFRGRGLGIVLMRECARRFLAAGCATWCLNVRPDNAPAVALYRRCGLRLAYASISVRIAWDRVGALPAGAGAVTPVAPADAARIDAAFGLPPGLAAAQVRHPARVVRQVVQAGECTGFAAFDPSFPGCFPFRARSAAAMRALLDGLRPHALPEHDDIQLVFEDSAALAAALERAGGRRTMEFVHFRGPLAAGADGAPALGPPSQG